MSVSSGFIELLQDALRDLAPVTARRMFGGAGLFTDGIMFGLVVDDVLYFKVDDANRPAYEAEKLEPFSYGTKARRVITSYWRAPERLLDDPEEMRRWANEALGAAKRAAVRKPPKRKSR
jgi:DNA transformation protein